VLARLKKRATVSFERAEFNQIDINLTHITKPEE
jgi:hypothetical protein